jgi:hypothetical protein
VNWSKARQPNQNDRPARQRQAGLGNDPEQEGHVLNQSKQAEASRLRASGLSLRAIGQQLHVNEKQIRRWLKSTGTDGVLRQIKGLDGKTYRVRVSAAAKEQVSAPEKQPSTEKVSARGTQPSSEEVSAREKRRAAARKGAETRRRNTEEYLRVLRAAEERRRKQRESEQQSREEEERRWKQRESEQKSREDPLDSFFRELAERVGTTPQQLRPHLEALGMPCYVSRGDVVMPHAWEVKKAYRAKAAVTHPDRGGNVADFQRLVKARDYLLARVK